jgi:tetratricopeptide (TPR) repeat protein
MGWVYRAEDKTSGEHVAIKVLRTDVGQSLDGAAKERFLREARVLAQLSHPSIIRYVAHGVTPEGAPYLAMEWIEGETLSERLARGVLDVPNAIMLARKTTEALASAHAVGIVHRDVKPSNLVLVGGELSRLKLIDFGVARVAFGPNELTRTGFAVGTASYMAPEQARGVAELDGRADLYALGVVLYKSLVGEAPFGGGDLLAVLAKVLLQTAPSVRLHRDDVPVQFDEIISSMLAKDRDQRPPTADKLLAQLDAIDLGDIATPASITASLRLSSTERRLVSLIAVRPPRRSPDATIVDDTSPLRSREPLLALAERFGARIEYLADGGVVAVLMAHGSGTDLASSAGRLALAMRPLVPVASLAVATGSAEVSGDVPVGEVIERAAMLASVSSDGVRLDDVTRNLLDERFVVVDGTLVGERETSEVARLLLGKPTPCMGRERELGSLIGIVEDCVRDSVSRAVVLTGPPGSGKSRIRHELLRSLASRWETAAVWIARGDPIGAGAHLDMVRQLARQALGNPRTREAIRTHVAALLPKEDLSRVSAFLAELLEIPEDTGDVQVGAARRDAMLMGDQMRLAWEDLLRAECARRLVVLVLEDLQWSDPTTVRWIDSALGQLSDLPLFVLASARPDVDEAFPRLWDSRVVSRMRLPPLGKNACELLVKHVLGDRASADVTARIIEQAAGNPFYLEELIRAAMEGDDKPPPTILAMVQAQLEKLDPLARSVLRAASVFGRTFQRDAVGRLIRSEANELEIEAAVGRLLEREMLRRQPGSQTDLIFRQALVREAAYSSLTVADRKAAHRLAGRWLEENGGASPLVLAEHFERGEDRVHAASALLRAAAQAIEGNDFASAIERGNKALAFGATGEDAARAHCLVAEAHRWRGEAEAALLEAKEAMKVATPYGRNWLRGLTELAHAAYRTSRLSDVVELVRDLEPTPPEGAGGDPSLAAERLAALGALARVFSSLTDRTVLDRVLERAENELALLGAPPPEVVANVALSRALRALAMRDFEGAIAQMMRRRRALLQVGNLRAACDAANTLGFVNLSLGAYAAAEEALRDGVEMAYRVGLVREIAQLEANLALVLARTNRLTEALALAKESLAGFKALGEGPLLASSLLDLAILSWDSGDIAKAEAYALEGVQMADAAHPTLSIYSRAWLSRFLLARKPAEALALAEDAYKRRDAIVIHDPGDAIVDLAYAEALQAVGRTAEARAIAERAAASVQEQARHIQDEALRRSFLEEVPENRAILHFARA